MLAVDTNVLVRYLTRDHAVQSPRALEIISHNDVWVPVTVVLEAEWVLRTVYRFAAGQFADAVVAVAGLPRLQLQHPGEVDRALTLHRRGMDFVDALHLVLADDCNELVTFDRPFAKMAVRAGLRARLL